MEDWPEVLSTSLAWVASDLASDDSCTLNLAANEVTEIKNALRVFRSQGLDGPCVNQANFPLPTLKNRLRHLAVDLHEGRGYCQIKGLCPADCSVEDKVILFLGVSSYIAERRARQDDAGNMLVHVHNIKQAYANRGERPPKYSKDAAPLHTDSFCDILAFMMQSAAASGGDISISSCASVYNEIQKRRPDLLEILAKDDWNLDSQSSLIPPQRRALLFYCGNHLMMDFARQALIGREGLPWTQGMAGASSKQIEALDVVESIAQAGSFVLPMQPGDMTFINNHALLHSRTSFVDSKQHVRHLYRLWLRNDDLAWKLPPSLQFGNARLYDQNGLPQRWELEPMPQFPIPWNEWSTSP